MKILVVDDNASLANTIRRCLEHEGYFVSIAKDGIAALELLEGNHFDLLLTDVHMPGMGGVELAKSAAGRFPKLNVVLMQGRSSARATLEATNRAILINSRILTSIHMVAPRYDTHL